ARRCFEHVFACGPRCAPLRRRRGAAPGPRWAAAPVPRRCRTPTLPRAVRVAGPRGGPFAPLRGPAFYIYLDLPAAAVGAAPATVTLRAVLAGAGIPTANRPRTRSAAESESK